MISLHSATCALRAVPSRSTAASLGRHHQFHTLTRPYRSLSHRITPNLIQYSLCTRARHLQVSSNVAAQPPKSRDRGPKSDEDTQTDFADMNILRNTPAPATAIDECTNDGFILSSGTVITDSGVLLVAGQAFNWKPWLAGGVETTKTSASLKDKKGLWDVQKDAWGLLELVWPKPDLLIIGTGTNVVPISPRTRRHINELGIRIEVQDTRNAAGQFNLLATERGLQQVAAALIPVGWKEGR